MAATIDRTALSRDVFLTFSGTSRTIRMVFRSNLDGSLNCRLKSSTSAADVPEKVEITSGDIIGFEKTYDSIVISATSALFEGVC